MDKIFGLEICFMDLVPNPIRPCQSNTRLAKGPFAALRMPSHLLYKSFWSTAELINRFSLVESTEPDRDAELL